MFNQKPECALRTLTGCLCCRLLPSAVASHFNGLIAQNVARATHQVFAAAQPDPDVAAALCGCAVQAYLRSPLKQEAPQASPAVKGCQPLSVGQSCMMPILLRTFVSTGVGEALQQACTGGLHGDHAQLQ